MLKKFNAVGFVIGVAIMIMSCCVFSFNAAVEYPSYEEVTLTYVSSPSYESYKRYGADAYTGMQQAAAQAANNLIPVFEAIEVNNKAIAQINDNNYRAAYAEAHNADIILATIRYSAGFIMIAIGLMVISKSVEFEVCADLVGKQRNESTEGKKKHNVDDTLEESGYFDVKCPDCGKRLSFIMGTLEADCPWCNHHLDLK